MVDTTPTASLRKPEESAEAPNEMTEYGVRMESATDCLRIESQKSRFSQAEEQVHSIINYHCRFHFVYI